MSGVESLVDDEALGLRSKLIVMIMINMGETTPLYVDLFDYSHTS